MMRMRIGVGLLLGAMMAVGAAAQTAKAQWETAFTWDGVRGAAVGGGGFWMNGAGFQLQDRFWRGLGVVADIEGAHVGNIDSTGVGLDMVTATFGPRWTWSHHRVDIYGQGLAGEAFGFHGLFPAPGGANTSDDTLAVQAGGGVDLALRPHIALRVIEADWVHTRFPNSAGNTQNDLRLDAGIVFRFR